MTNSFPTAAHSGSDLVRIIQRLIAVMDCIPYWFIALAARAFPAAVFWQSGETKVAGWHLKPSAIALFQNEYQLPLIDPTILALLFMTMVIETFVYPGAWPTHGVWATCFLVVIARGPGAFSLDHLIARQYPTKVC